MLKIFSTGKVRTAEARALPRRFGSGALFSTPAAMKIVQTYMKGQM